LHPLLFHFPLHALSSSDQCSCGFGDEAHNFAAANRYPKFKSRESGSARVTSGVRLQRFTLPVQQGGRIFGSLGKIALRQSRYLLRRST
jgi:hypothetical protein